MRGEWRGPGEQQRQYRDEIWRRAAAHEWAKWQAKELERALWGTEQMVLPLVNEVRLDRQRR